MREENRSLFILYYCWICASASTLHTICTYSMLPVHIPSLLSNLFPIRNHFRVKRNCSDTRDFQMEANKLRTRLLEKGYSKKMLKKAYQKAQALDRQEILYPKNQDKKENVNRIRFITKFCDEHKAIRKTLQKYWYLLQADNKLKDLVGLHPEIIFRQARSIRDQLVTSHYTGFNRKDPCKNKGLFPCEGCSFYSYIDIGSEKVLRNGNKHYSKHYVNCKTAAIIYLLTCTCNSFYSTLAKQNVHSEWE